MAQRGTNTTSDPDEEPVSLRTPALPSYLALIGSVVQWAAEEAGLDEERRHDLVVAVDEACTNIVRYAFPEGEPGEMAITCTAFDDGLEVRIVDDGQRFNVEEGIQTAAKKRARDPASGGMGLDLMHQLADEVHYEWTAEAGNRLTLIKRR